MHATAPVKEERVRVQERKDASRGDRPSSVIPSPLVFPRPVVSRSYRIRVKSEDEHG